MDYFKIGQKIRKFRKAKGLSQEGLAEKIGISVTHMSHIETGNTKLSLPVFVEIARALEIQTDDLLFDACVGRGVAEREVVEILNTCSTSQLRIIVDIIKAAKTSLDTYS